MKHDPTPLEVERWPEDVRWMWERWRVFRDSRRATVEFDDMERLNQFVTRLFRKVKAV